MAESSPPPAPLSRYSVGAGFDRSLGRRTSIGIILRIAPEYTIAVTRRPPAPVMIVSMREIAGSGSAPVSSFRSRGRGRCGLLGGTAFVAGAVVLAGAVVPTAGVGAPTVFPDCRWSQSWGAAAAGPTAVTTTGDRQAECPGDHRHVAGQPAAHHTSSHHVPFSIISLRCNKCNSGFAVSQVGAGCR